MAERVDGQLILSHHEADLMREWFNVVEDMNPDYLKNKDYKLAQQVYDFLNLRQTARMMAGFRRTLIAETSDVKVANQMLYPGKVLSATVVEGFLHRGIRCGRCGCNLNFGPCLCRDGGGT